MSNFEKENVLRQDGGLPDLGLGLIDEHLSREGKSIEALSDPEFRVFVLWTTIGQYRGAAEFEKEKHGEDIVLNDARYSQLMSTWTHEYRRVHPRESLEDSSRSFTSNVIRTVNEEGGIKAYDSLTNIRNEMPELIHPDIRFDLYEIIRTKSKNTLLEELVLTDMTQETMPGGVGYCDNTERLRRYLVLAKSDATFFQIIDNYLYSLQKFKPNQEALQYFEDNTSGVSELCELVAERADVETANYLFGKKILTLNDEVTLCGAFI